MGGGDLKLMVLMGLLLGPAKLFVAAYSAVILGSVAGVIWGIRKGKIKGLKIPFALFLSIGTVIAIVWGERILSYYLVWV
jgi:prepilin signal peptidase PulO-like enzyme (type II secretory pathway)